MSRKKKSLFIDRLDLIKSLSFKSIAAEVNARRLLDWNRRLENVADWNEHQRAECSRMVRLVEQQGWPLRQLPSDMRADAKRMKRALKAIHEILGGYRVFPFTEQRLKKEMCCRGVKDPRTARRAIADLRDGAIIGVEKRERPRREGGQAENGFLIVWATLKDEAERQGLQPSLFDDAATIERGPSESNTATAIECGSRGELVATESGHSGHPPGHSGHPPGHSGHPPGHSGHPLSSRARAPSPSFSTISSPSPSEGKRKISDGGWGEARDLLRSCGVRCVIRCLRVAEQNGWLAEQVVSLLRDTVGKRIGDTPIYKPGQVYWQLTEGEPGSRIDQPCEEYRRLQRDLQQTPSDVHHATRVADEAAETRRSFEAARDRLESEFGTDFDRLSLDEQIDLLPPENLLRKRLVLQRRRDLNWQPSTAERLSLLKQFAAVTTTTDHETLSGVQDETPSGLSQE